MNAKSHAVDSREINRLAGFSLIPIIGLALWKTCALTLFHGAFRDDLYPYYSYSMLSQMLVVFALIVLERYRRLSFSDSKTLFIVPGITMVMGSALAILPLLFNSESHLLPCIGSLIHGASSAAILLGLGYYLSSIEPKRSALYVAAAFFLYSLLTGLFVTLPENLQALSAILVPLPVSILLLLSITGEKNLDFDRKPARKTTLKDLPWGMFALLLGCSWASNVMRALLKFSASAPELASNLFWPIVYLLILIVFAVWILFFRRDDPERLWPLFIVVIFAGLFLFSSWGFASDWPQALLSATQNCLPLFYWVLLSGTIFKKSFPVFSFSALVICSLAR